MMKNLFNYSYPCLKTTVEKNSHSDTADLSKFDNPLSFQ